MDARLGLASMLLLAGGVTAPAADATPQPPEAPRRPRLRTERPAEPLVLGVGSSLLVTEPSPLLLHDSARAVLVRTLREGDRVRVLETGLRFVRVRAPEGTHGWVDRTRLREP